MRGNEKAGAPAALVTSATSATSATLATVSVDDDLVLRASGPPDAEYALFDFAELDLRATDPGRTREHGYQTSAGQARARLANLRITADAARTIAIHLQPTIAEAYARGIAARLVAAELGPRELLAAETFDAATRSYRGTFLDLAALARDLGVEHASATLQALHLALVLEVVPDDAIVALVTEGATREAKAGARTYRRPSFAPLGALEDALVRLASGAPTPSVDGTLPRGTVIAFLRARADDAPDAAARARYEELEARVTTREMPERGPLASADLWAIELALDAGDPFAASDALDRAERRHGRTPATTYLRARTSLVLRREPPKLIAERVSALALSMSSFQELSLLAAEAWVEAGEPRRAMPYARDLVEAAVVDEGLLLRAKAILARAASGAPPPRTTLVDAVTVAPQPSRPPQGSGPPPRTSFPDVPVSLELGDLRRSAPPRISSQPPAPGSVPPRTTPFMKGASLPPFRDEDPPARAPSILPPFPSSPDELVEYLSSPAGDHAVARGARPRTPLEARLQHIAMAQELARDYRLQRGIVLRADLSGVEAIQTVLLETFPSRGIDTEEEARELRRHGAVLAEILARRLGAVWVDISPEDTGHWTMLVPPRTRIWPFGRVARFVAMAHRERDLVSYYLELERRMAPGR